MKDINVAMTEIQVRPDLVLLLGLNAISLFDYYGVDDLHGLNRSECLERISFGGTYIDGMCNVVPGTESSPKYYLFINRNALSLIYIENYGLVFHEATHYCFRKYWDKLQEREEQLITEAENLALDIYRLIF